MMSQYPLGLGRQRQALAYALSRPREIAFAGEPDAADTQALLQVVRGGYRPFQVVVLSTSHDEAAQGPLSQDRGLVDGQATTYVCRDFTCQAPVTDPLALEQLLGAD